jgi:hypothetical protein
MAHSGCHQRSEWQCHSSSSDMALVEAGLPEGRWRIRIACNEIIRRLTMPRGQGVHDPRPPANKNGGRTDRPLRLAAADSVDCEARHRHRASPAT